MSLATNLVAILAGLILVAQFTSTTFAVPLPLPPNGSVVPTQSAPPVGAIHVDGTVQQFLSQDAPINPNGTSYTGVLTSDVWTNYPGNLFGAGRLTFTFVLRNNGPDRLDRLSVSDYSAYSTDVEYDAVTVPGALPVGVDRTAAPGETVIWRFGNLPGLTAGLNSARLIVHTNATQYVQSLAGILNGAPASALSFGPSPIPEPATATATALIALGMLVRRR